MALDDLHARRLATVASIVASALDRMGLVLDSLESSPGGASREQIERAREKMDEMRRKLREALDHFSVRLVKPDPRQALAAELSTLWVVLENSLPERMKGYGKDFTPADRERWEGLIRGLLEDLNQLRDRTRRGRK
jgi:hypothetical protein